MSARSVLKVREYANEPSNAADREIDKQGMYLENRIKIQITKEKEIESKYQKVESFKTVRRVDAMISTEKPEAPGVSLRLGKSVMTTNITRE